MRNFILAEPLPFSQDSTVIANTESRGSEIPLKNKHPDHNKHQ